MRRAAASSARGSGGRGLALWLLVLASCAGGASGTLPSGKTPAIGNFGRPPGMPIGTGPGGQGEGALASHELTAVNADSAGDAVGLAIPTFEHEVADDGASAPCSGCLELHVDVRDINQRDEFSMNVDGATVTRVVWTLLVTFNSDQLAVQPFVDDQRGKYTALHVNTFPLRAPVRVEQDHTGPAQEVGLVVGSSGAWTGNETMSVFVDSVRVEGPKGFTREFTKTAEGLSARTHGHNPEVVVHPDR